MIRKHFNREGNNDPDNRLWREYLELYSRLSHRSERRSLPVGLFCLLPHDHVKGRGVLVAKDEASIVIICHCVHMEGSLEVDPTESFVAYRCEQERRSTQQSLVVQDRLKKVKHLKLTDGNELCTYLQPGQGQSSWSALSPCPVRTKVEGSWDSFLQDD